MAEGEPQSPQMALLYRAVEESVNARMAELKEAANLDRGGSGPHDPIMDGRVARLEDDVKDLRSDMKQVRIDLAYLKGRAEHLPTTFVLVTTLAASQITLLGFTFALLKLAH